MGPRLSRREFLDRRREICRARYDRLHAATYDEIWGAVDPTHAVCVSALVAMTPPGGELLDAACGTGKHWPPLRAAGRRVYGIDQSAAMLAQAAAKHPDVLTEVAALQDLHRLTALHGRFDGLLCVDAMETVGPEDWPVVLAGFHLVLREHAPAYLTVELPDEPLPEPDGDLAAGEVLADGAYHYYPARAQVHRWLAGAGFDITGERTGDGYLHLHCRVAVR